MTPVTLEDGARIRIGESEIIFAEIAAADDGDALEVTMAGTIGSAEQSVRSVSLLLCDIRGFSTMAEKIPSSDLAQMLGAWFREAGNVIQRGGGTIDKFIGDAMLACWQKSETGPSACDAAFNAGKQLLDLAGSITWPVPASHFDVVVALHFGTVSCSNIGLVAQRDATINGDAVNTVFRIEPTRPAHGNVRGFFRRFAHGTAGCRFGREITQRKAAAGSTLCNHLGSVQSGVEKSGIDFQKALSSRSMRKKPIMIMACTSDAGKSFLVAALCRHFSNRGVRVAPFKAQNMSNNAAVTPDGLEIGRAQYFQALAARVVPQTRMNPVLLKPTADTFSQVILMGKPASGISRIPWMERKQRLWPVVCEALSSLQEDFEQVVIEGAGSPAEINLRESDIVNMSVAVECGADVYLVADIDRCGAFAHLLGTWMCLEPQERKLIKGFVLNKFRGDPLLLGNAMDWLKDRTGIPTVGIIPMIRHALPEEDTLHHRAVPVAGNTNIALIAYPYASNLDEFDPLIHEPGVSVVPHRDFARLDGYDAVILPGSKNTAGSLMHIRQNGLASEIVRAAGSGIPVFGVCGGMQMLGRSILDPHKLEGGDMDGLGLLDVETVLDAEKTTRQRQVRWFGGGDVNGYEIHHGRTQAGPEAVPHLDDSLGWEQKNVCGVYIHGLFEDTMYRQHFLDRLGWRGKAEDWHSRIDQEIDRVAAVVEETGWFAKLGD